MPRFFVDSRDWRPPQFILRGDEAHHAARVLRLEPGREVRVFQGEGQEWRARVRSVDEGRIELDGLEPIAEPVLPARLILLQALPKGAKMELIVQKAVELGVAEIRPIAAARSVMRLDDAQAAKKTAKWQRIALEAAKQCGHPLAPAVQPPGALTQSLDALALEGVELLLLTSLQDDTVPLLRALERSRAGRRRPPACIAVLIGPEGDFTQDEIATARAAGAVPVSLGPLVLRTETAALAALAQLGGGLMD